MSVTSITRYRPAKPVTTAEVLDACDKAIATDRAIRGDLAEAILAHLRHVMKLTTLPDSPPRPVLRPLALLDVAQADKFLMELDDRTAGADLPRAMYLLGQAEGHLQNLSDTLHAATGLPR